MNLFPLVQTPLVVLQSPVAAVSTTVLLRSPLAHIVVAAAFHIQMTAAVDMAAVVLHNEVSAEIQFRVAADSAGLIDRLLLLIAPTNYRPMLSYCSYFHCSTTGSGAATMERSPAD
jgi:hypothetical protein